MVFDQSVNIPGCDWTDEYYMQGFEHRNSVFYIPDYRGKTNPSDLCPLR